MEITGTKEAFMHLISQPGFAGRSGLNKGMVSAWASGLRVPTIDKMEAVLLQAGSSVISEKVWNINVDMRMDLQKLAKQIENEINTNTIQFFTGNIKVHLQGSGKHDPDVVDFFGKTYQIMCVLEKEFPNKLHTSIQGEGVDGLMHNDSGSDKFQVHEWVSEIVGKINDVKTTEG